MNASAFTSIERTRIDKWLWAARFYKTRGLASQEVTKGRVTVNGQECKPSREIKVGDLINVRRQDFVVCAQVLALSNARGPASIAQGLYQETEESRATRLRMAEQRRLAPEPALTLAAGRPTKRERRALQNHNDAARHDWNDRWSAALDD